MSLTSHLKDPASPIGQFIKQRFAYTANLTNDAKNKLQAVITLLPTDTTPGYPYGTIGTAIDYRIRYAFSITPSRLLKAWYGATSLTYKPLKNKNDIPIDEGEILRVIGGMRYYSSGVAQGPYPLKLILSFFDSLDTTLLSMQPVGRTLEMEEEHLLARYCFVLALFEEVFRSGSSYSFKQGPLMIPTTKDSVDELLAIPHDTALDDLCSMFSLFNEGYHHLLLEPHILNPSFTGSKYVGGADADIIINGCLIDIKASIVPEIEAKYLHQLAGYLLLDFDDKLHIDSVGIYMARQGMLIRWAVDEFLRLLTRDAMPSLSVLRQEFRDLCQTLRMHHK